MKTKVQFKNLMEINGSMSKEFLQAHENAVKIEAVAFRRSWREKQGIVKSKKNRKITFGKVIIVPQSNLIEHEKDPNSESNVLINSTRAQIVDIKYGTESSKFGKVKSASFIENNWHPRCM